MSFVVFQSCEKSAIDPNDVDLVKLEVQYSEMDQQIGELTYVCDGKVIESSSIEWGKDGLNIFYGFDDTKNVYVFNTEEEMVEWLKKNDSDHAHEALSVLKDIETAKKYAEQIGEFEKEETSSEFENYLMTNFTSKSGAKGLGTFHHDTWYGGSNFLISPFPKRKLRSKNDDKTSSLKYFGNTMKMSSKKNWNGSHSWVFAVTYIFLPTLEADDFDNKLSSYWNW